MILDTIKRIKPQSVLDIGCGCGAFTKEIIPFAGHITAIDTEAYLIKRCQAEIQADNVSFMVKNGSDTGFEDRSFDLVFARCSLHHSPLWKNIINEMLRLSKGPVLIEEPVDSDRNEAKIVKRKAWDFFLDLQREIGQYHAPHFEPEILTNYLDNLKADYKSELHQNDETTEFDEFFSLYDRYAKKSKMYEYRTLILEEFRNELNGAPLCEDDLIYIEITGGGRTTE